MLRFPSAADAQRTGAGAQAGGTAPEGPQGRGPPDGAASASSKAFSEGGQRLPQLLSAFLAQGPVARLPSPRRRHSPLQTGTLLVQI